MVKALKKSIVEIALGTIIFCIALVFRNFFLVNLFLFLVSYLIIGRSIVWKAIRNIIHGKVFDENFLLTVATGGAFAIKAFPEAVAVMLFFRVGELFEEMAVNRSKRSIKSLLDIRADYANVRIDGKIKKIRPEEIKIGSLIIVKPGEKIPLDGTIEEGESMVDTSALTGESRPKMLKKGDTILSGMINTTGVLTIYITKKFGESTVSKIINLVEKAISKKAPTERFITRFARFYTPAVVILAFSLAIGPVILSRIPFFTPFFSHEESFSVWIYRALIFLVIACPCALVISIPLGFFGGIGAASRRGILVKGSNYLEGLSNLHTVIFDKTGTLTKGLFKVTNVVSCNGFSKDELLRLAAEVEVHSNHPIAKSISEAYGKEVDENCVEDYEEIPGYGVRAKVDGRSILAGNDKLLHKENIAHDTCYVEETVVHIVVDNMYGGYIVISDEIKEDASTTIENLRRDGIKKQIIVTGDSKVIAQSVSEKLRMDGFFAELLPHEKVEVVEKLVENKTHKNERIAFIGDGINDAPVLARSDIGIAMGALGSDAAIEAADVVLMTDELIKIHEAILIARRTKVIVWQNIVLALGIKSAFLFLGAIGFVAIWEAVFADAGVALLAILNASRTIGYRMK